MRDSKKKKPAGEKPRYTTLQNVIYFLQDLWGYDKPMFLCFALKTLCNAIFPFVTVLMPKLLIDQLTGERNVGYMTAIIIAAGLVTFITLSANMVLFCIFIQPRLNHMGMHYRTQIGIKAMYMDFSHTENPAMLDTAQKARRGSYGLRIICNNLYDIGPSLLSLIGYISILMFLNPLIIIALMALVAFNYWVNLRSKQYEYSVYNEINPIDRLLDYLHRTMHDFKFGKDIRLFHMSKWLNGKYKTAAAESTRRMVRIFNRQFSVGALYAVSALIEESLLYSYLIYQVIYSGMSIGNFTMFATAIRSFSSAMSGILNSIAGIKEGSLMANDYRSFIEMPSKVDAEAKAPLDASKEVVHSIVFENVSFRYPGQERYAIKNLSVEIKEGERLAIVGLNGAGKSTFIKLLIRLYDPTEGRILLNGTDIKDFDLTEYYRLFSVVFQEIRTYALKVAENVSMKDVTKTDRTLVKSALERSGLAEKVKTLKKGMDTSVLKVIDDEGIEFSGGENQKLSLARALYKNAPVVVLDEPASALDALAEQEMYQNFDRMIENRIAIYISHRLSSCRFCHKILVFDDGRIIEKGNHEQLMARGGKYAQMFNVQAQYYKGKGEAV